MEEGSNRNKVPHQQMYREPFPNLESEQVHEMILARFVLSTIVTFNSVHLSLA